MINPVEETNAQDKITSDERTRFSLSTSPGNPFISSLLFFADKGLGRESGENIVREEDIFGNIFDKQLLSSEKSLLRSPNNPHLLNNVGVSLLNAGKIAEAIECFNKALAIQPDLISASFGLAKAYLRAGNHEASLKIYDRLLIQHPKNAVVHINLAELYFRTAVRNQSLELLGKAEEHLRLLDPENPSAQNNLGLISALKGNVREAVAHFRKAISIEPRSTVFHYNLGVSYFGFHNYKKAAHHFSACLALEGKNLSAAKGLAKACLEMGDYARAQLSLKNYKEEGKSDPEYFKLLADSSFFGGNYHFALTCLLELLRLIEAQKRPSISLASTHNNIGSTYQALHQFEKAEEHFKKSMQYSPPDPNAYYNLASQCLAFERLNDAGEIIFLLEKVAPTYRNLPSLRARYHVEQRDYEHAIEDFKSAIKADPKDPRSYAGLSYMLSEIKYDYDQALDVVRSGLHFCPSNLGLLNNLAYNYLMKGDVYKGREILDSIKDPSAGIDLYINATRGLLLIREGALPEANRFYQLAISLAQESEIKSKLKQKQNLELGRYWASKGQYEQACKYFEQALSIETKSNMIRDQVKEISDRMNKAR